MGKPLKLFKNTRLREEFSLAYWHRIISFCVRFTLSTPYLIEFDLKSNDYILRQQTRLIKLLVATFHVAVILPQCFNILNFTVETFYDPASTLEAYFACFYALLWLSHVANVLRIFWKNNEEQLVLIRQVCKVYKSLRKLGVALPSLKKVKIYSGALIVACFLWGVVEVILIAWKIPEQGFLVAYIRTIINVQSFHGLPKSSISTLASLPIVALMKQNPWNIQLEAFMLMCSELLSEQVSHFTELICLTNALVFFWIVKIFTSHLKSHNIPPQQWKLVQRILYEIIQLADDMKAAYGPVFTGACFMYLPYYIFLLKRILSQIGPLYLIRLGLWVGSFLVFMIVSAESNKMLRGVTSWLRNTEVQDICRSVKYRLEYHEHIIVILSRFQNEVGVSGNGFTITYKFVGVMSEILASYAIAIYQLF